MSKESTHWLNDRHIILQFLKKLIRDLPELSQKKMTIQSGGVLFEQGMKLESIYLLLEGEVALLRQRGSDKPQEIMRLEPGHFVGLVAFTTSDYSLTRAVATKPSEALCIEKKEFDAYLNDHIRLRHPLQQLMILNLVERYKANLKLHVRSQNLYNQLQDERNQLKEVNEALKQAQKTIVHQEKKAMLGQLIAGFAHEINNPATALLRSAETLEEETNSSEGIPAALKKVFEESLKQLPASTEEMRQKMELLEAPSRRELPRSLKRKIAGTPEPLFSALSQIRETEKLSDIVQRFYNARNLQNIRSAAKRIADFAGSLKNYSRQDNNRIEKLDVTLGIKDSLQILSHRLKFITLQTMLQPLPATCADHGELNQVWTNIIINACDALQGKGILRVSSEWSNGYIIVRFEDSGLGVPENERELIFEPNYTKKHTLGDFGLGLGLSISREIVLKHDGEIGVETGALGGAGFWVRLPLNQNC